MINFLVQKKFGKQERDWKNILKNDYGFDNFKESFYFKNYVRLLRAERKVE